MDTSELKRRLSIGFMGSLSLKERDKYINDGTPVFEVLKQNSHAVLKERDVEDSMKWLEKGGDNKVWWYTDSSYPDFGPLKGDLPYFLFVKGNIPQNIPRLKHRSIAIVGTRRADNMGLQMSYRLGFEAAVNDITVVSGLADGCDQAALSGAVAAEKPSVAVLGAGLEVDYPAFTVDLKKKIASFGGALVSQYPPNMPPLPGNFPKRNVVIASIADCTLVVQAPSKSGALITSRLALEMNKEVYVSSAGLGASYGRAGSTLLSMDGANVISSIANIYDCNYFVDEAPFDGANALRYGNKKYICRQKMLKYID